MLKPISISLTIKMYSYFSILFLLYVYFRLTNGKINNEEHVNQTSETNQQEMLNQFENTMKTLFSIWKTETNQKMESIELMIPDLEESMNRKLFGLRNSILDKLEQYIDGKLNNLQRNITKKLKQNMNANALLHKKTVESINFKLDVLEKNISKHLERKNNWESEAMKNITDLEGIMNRKLEISEKKVLTNLQENIKYKFDVLGENISMVLERNINCKFNAIKSVTDFENNKQPKFDVKFNINASESSLEKIFEKNKLPCKEERISRSASAFFSMDNEALNYVTVKRNTTGHRTHSGIHFALKSDEYVYIELSDKEDFSGTRCCLYVGKTNYRYKIELGYNNIQYTELYINQTQVQYIHTPDILSSTQFRAFYIKIIDGNLKFGKEGDSHPIIWYFDADLSLLNYFRFTVYGGSAKIRYCPSPVEESPLDETENNPLNVSVSLSEKTSEKPKLPCKEESVSSNGYTQYYSLHNETLNPYLTVKRNSTGHRMYSELHFAALTYARVNILKLELSEKEDNSGILCKINLGWMGSPYTSLECNGDQEQSILTRDMLSSTRFVAFYIKIDEGYLQFGKEDDHPVISYSNASFGLLNYYRIYFNHGAKIRYCSAPVEGA